MPSGYLNEDQGATLFCDDCGQQVRTNEHHECDGPPADLMSATLCAGDEFCERGNTALICPDSGNLIAWLGLSEDLRLEVSWAPGNYPGLNVVVKEITDVELAQHINTKLGGWHVRKVNINGVVQRDGYVVGTEEEE